MMSMATGVVTHLELVVTSFGQGVTVLGVPHDRRDDLKQGRLRIQSSGTTAIWIPRTSPTYQCYP